VLKKHRRLMLFRYLIVGALNNLIGYAIYLLLTWAWLGPKSAAGLTYLIAGMLGFYTHSKFSFAYNGRRLASIFRYVVAHCIGYGVNVGLLYFFVDLLAYPHQLIQIIAVISVSGLLLFLFRYFVFPISARE